MALLPTDRLMGMYRWMGSHFHDWIDYNKIVFLNGITRMRSHIFWTLGVRKFWQLKGFFAYKKGKICGKKIVTVFSIRFAFIPF